MAKAVGVAGFKVQAFQAIYAFFPLIFPNAMRYALCSMPLILLPLTLLYTNP